MSEVQRDANRSASVPGGRLNPDFVERPLPEDPTVTDTIQRNTVSQAQVPASGLLVRVPRLADHDFFGDDLDRSGDIHLALGQQAFRFAGGPRRGRSMVNIEVMTR